MKIVYLKYIFQGWLNFFFDLFSDIKYKKEFDERMNICRQCEHKQGPLCGVCGCVLKAKTKSEDSECPEGKWLSIKEIVK